MCSYAIILTAMIGLLGGCSMNNAGDSPMPDVSAFDLTHEEKADLIEKASKNDNKASFSLYQFNNSVKRNRPEAMRWLKKSAKDGNVGAQWSLGYTYLYYKEFEDIEEGKRWLKIAAANGSEKAKMELIRLEREERN
jgi:TPR repeat protein